MKFPLIEFQSPIGTNKTRILETEVSVNRMFQSPVGTNKNHVWNCLPRAYIAFQSPIGTYKTIHYDVSFYEYTTVSIPYRYK